MSRAFNYLVLIIALGMALSFGIAWTQWVHLPDGGYETGNGNWSPY